MKADIDENGRVLNQNYKPLRSPNKEISSDLEEALSMKKKTPMDIMQDLFLSRIYDPNENNFNSPYQVEFKN